MPRKNEKEFLTRLKKEFKRRGHWFYKIPDAPSAKRFMISRPFDCFVVMFNRAAGVEGKFMKEPGSFGLKDLRDVQIDGLNKITERGRGLGFVFLEVRWARGEYRFYWFEWENFKKAQKYTKEELDVLLYVRRENDRYDLNIFERDFKYWAAVKGLK